MDGTGTALCVEMAASIVDQNAPHHLCSDREKVRAVIPLNISLIDETDKCFVDQRRGLQRMAPALAVHIVMGQTMQLAVNQRRQMVESCLVSGAPIQKQLGDVQLFAVVHYAGKFDSGD